MEHKHRMTLKRHLQKIQDASNTYSASARTHEDTRAWIDACSDFENFIYRNFVQEEEVKWFKYHLDKRTAELEALKDEREAKQLIVKAEKERKTALVKFIEKIIDDNEKKELTNFA